MSDAKLEKIETLKAVYERAKRGIGAEKDTAMNMLEKLMVKYGITIDDLEDTNLEWYDYKYKSAYKVVLAHIRANFFGDNLPPGHRKKKCIMTIKVTKAQFLEFKAFADHYLLEYDKEIKKQKKIIQTAFITVDELFAAEGVSKGKGKQMTREEQMEIAQMMQKMEKSSVRRAIESK